MAQRVLHQSGQGVECGQHRQDAENASSWAMGWDGVGVRWVGGWGGGEGGGGGEEGRREEGRGRAGGIGIIG